MHTTRSEFSNRQTEWTGETPGADNARIIGDAQSGDSLRFRDIAVIGFVTCTLAALAGFAFAGWTTHGTGILLDYARSGLSWCL